MLFALLAPGGLCQSDLRKLQNLHIHVRNVWGLPRQQNRYSPQLILGKAVRIAATLLASPSIN